MDNNLLMIRKIIITRDNFSAMIAIMIRIKSSRFPLAGVWWNGKRRLYIQFTYYI